MATELHTSLMQLALVLDAASACYATMSLHSGSVAVTIHCPTDLDAGRLTMVLRRYGARSTLDPSVVIFDGSKWLAAVVNLDGIEITINGPHEPVAEAA